MRLIRYEAWTRAFLSHASLQAGAEREAADKACRALEVARRHKYLDLEVFALRLLGMSLVVGDPAAAEEGERHLREAVASAEARELRPELAHGHRELGLFSARTGRIEDARRHLAFAASLYRAMEMPFWLAQV